MVKTSKAGPRRPGQQMGGSASDAQPQQGAAPDGKDRPQQQGEQSPPVRLTDWASI
jgi:hypothetical protein